jgi:hypothetical protein
MEASSVAWEGIEHIWIQKWMFSMNSAGAVSVVTIWTIFSRIWDTTLVILA